MPTLDWIGKDKVVSHHLNVPFRVLEHQYTFPETDSDGKHESENKITKGDNLEALKALLPEYVGRVKWIYIDIILQRLIQFIGSRRSLPLAG